MQRQMNWFHKQNITECSFHITECQCRALIWELRFCTQDLHLGCIQEMQRSICTECASYCGDTAIVLSSSPDLSQWFKLAETDCEVSCKEKQIPKACVVSCAWILFAFFTSGLLSTTQTSLETELWLRYKVNYRVKYHRTTSMTAV